MKRQRSVSRYAEVLPPSDSKTPTLSQRSESPLFLPLAGSHHPFCKYRFTTILATLVMAHEEDTPKQQSGQEKPVVRRDKVVVTKVTSQELSIIEIPLKRPLLERNYENKKKHFSSRSNVVSQYDDSSKQVHH